MSFQPIIDRLLQETRANRVNLRRDEPGENFPVVAEALASGTRSIKGDTQYVIDVHASPTFAFFKREPTILVVNDCVNSDPPTPQVLIDVYGVRAEIVAPLVRDSRVIGLLAVHDTRGPREWTDADVAAVDEAARRVIQELEAEISKRTPGSETLHPQPHD